MRPERRRALILVVVALALAGAAFAQEAAPAADGPEPGLFDRITFWVEGIVADLNARLEGASVGLALGIFFVAGFLTSLTPCVYPIIPIVIAFMGGAGKRSRAHTVGLALVYVAGMALVYTALGVLAAVVHAPFGTLTQTWWAYFLVAAVILLFGLSMLGLFNIQLPQSMTSAAGGGRRGIGGAFVMGATSAVVAAPCAAPVVGSAMVWISTHGRIGLGAATMFSFSLGLGLLLVVLGISAGLAARAPRTGVWTEYVKKGFGVVMVIIAIWFAYKGVKMF